MGRLTPGAGVLGRRGGAHGQEGPGRNETERRGRRPEVKDGLKTLELEETEETFP